MVFDVGSDLGGKFWSSMVFNDLFLDQKKKRPLSETGETGNSDFKQTEATQQR